MDEDEPVKPLRDELGHFLKGFSGNPRGRLGGYISLSHNYRDQLQMVCLTDPKKRTYGEMIADAIIQRAVDGDLEAAREIADRLEGKPRQSVITENHNDPYAQMTDQELAAELERLESVQ